MSRELFDCPASVVSGVARECAQIAAKQQVKSMPTLRAHTANGELLLFLSFEFPLIWRQTCCCKRQCSAQPHNPEALPPQLGAIKIRRNKNRMHANIMRHLQYAWTWALSCATICYTSDYMHRDGNTVYLPMTIFIILSNEFDRRSMRHPHKHTGESFLRTETRKTETRYGKVEAKAGIA